MDLLPTMSMTKERLFFFLRLTADQKLKVRKNVALQFLGGKSVDQLKSCVPCSIRTIYRWASRFLPGGMENLRERQKTGRPRPGTDRHAAWIRIAVADQDPAQGLGECAWQTAQRVRQAWREKFGSVLSVSPVRRSLRRLPLPPQRPQRRTTKHKPADGQRWQDPELPKFLRRAREWGALLACAAESGLAAQSVCGRTGVSTGRPPSGGGPAGASASTGWRPAARRAGSITWCGKIPSRRRSSGSFWSRSLRRQTGRFC